ncbi:corrinoid protein [Clostridium grantii]|uniref:5-methyltetrahydrofolate--homocysteine methyltransferase n=1 Tax=Clostridium grantii DSM 8605 TaxID=1121316 RepID=A0A1M5T3V3_9CLOT|nr:corrinoid protein [Clostridium grantii]SHH45280.1 5-methyltetrahydrofolate--homocysteine methyltransferase [Clostridium grantii DSM 8605]
MSLYEEMSLMLQKGNAKKVQELVEEAISNNEKADTILNEGLLSGMSIIGEKFKKNEIYVPEVLIAARAMNSGLKVLEPLLASQGVKPLGKFVIGTVKGDLHDIGKNLVAMMVKGAGFEVIDVGVDVSPEKFVDAAIESGADIIAMSALLTTTMGRMKDVIEELNKRGVRDNFKVMVGGAPITTNFAKEIGADYYTPDAASAAEVAKSLVS